MKKELSVLIPTYNSNCSDLVFSVHGMLKQMNIPYEIIVADDGSTDEESVNSNKSIEKLENVRYIIRKENVGRACIRNFLAQQAQYKWLLFLDSDVTIDRSRFIQKYLEQNFDVILGGIIVVKRMKKLENNLRYIVESKYMQSSTTAKRLRKQAKEFHTANFLVRKDIILKVPFNENFKHYGYEDVLFGKELNANGYHIHHINNPVTLIDFEENERFVEKTEESLHTLHEFKNELKGYSALLKYAWLKPVLKPLYHIIGKPIRNNLAGNNPKVSLFNIYKLLYYCSL
jgi:glycosyltransferase involved in cell wall biosynthesis